MNHKYLGLCAEDWHTINTIGESKGACRAHATPYGTQFFCFCIHFHRKAPTSEVHAPSNGCTPPMGNPGSATEYWMSGDLKNSSNKTGEMK